MKSSFIIVSSLLGVLTGCHYADQDTPDVPPPHEIAQVVMTDKAKNGATQVKQGMTEDQAFAILGRPDYRTGTNGEASTYRYGSTNKDYLDLAIDKGKLVSLTGQFNDTSIFMDTNDPAPLTAKRGHDPHGKW